MHPKNMLFFVRESKRCIAWDHICAKLNQEWMLIQDTAFNNIYGQLYTSIQYKWAFTWEWQAGIGADMVISPQAVEHSIWRQSRLQNPWALCLGAPSLLPSQWGKGDSVLSYSGNLNLLCWRLCNESKTQSTTKLVNPMRQNNDKNKLRQFSWI